MNQHAVKLFINVMWIEQDPVFRGKLSCSQGSCI